MNTEDIVARTLSRAQHAASIGPALVSAERLRDELRKEGLIVHASDSERLLYDVSFDSQCTNGVSIPVLPSGMYDAEGLIYALLALKGVVNK